LAFDVATVLERKRPLSDGMVKCLMKMLLEGVSFLHQHNVVHRDLKPANLLVDESGLLKVADFGSARFLPFEVSNSDSFDSFDLGKGDQLMTRDVCTRWYKAPEMLFGSVTYSLGVDLWAVGCTFADFVSPSDALFPGGSDLEQLCLIFQAIGTPDEDDWPEVRELPDYPKVSFAKREPKKPVIEMHDSAESEACADLLWAFLRLNPKQRISAAEALRQKFFQGCISSPADVVEGLPESGHHQAEANVGPISPVGLSEFGSDCSLLSISGELEPVTVETTSCGLWEEAGHMETPERSRCRTPSPPRDGIHKFKLKR